MSFPSDYSSFVPGYSNPSTPQGFAWDAPQAQAASAASTPQDVQAISPVVFQQPQQLSPDLRMTTSLPQDLIQDQQAAYEHPRTIQLQERVVPSQMLRFDNIDESHFRDAGKQRAAASPRVGVDEMRSSTSPASSGPVGPSRVPHGRAHTQSHPYRRPHSAASPVGTASGSRAPAAARSVSSTSRAISPAVGSDEPLIFERTSQLRAGSRRQGLPMSPAVGSGKAVSCPAMHVWRVSTMSSPSESRDQQGQGAARGGGHSGTTNSPTATGTTSPIHTPAIPSTTIEATQAHALPHEQAEVRPRFAIRTDIHFDMASNMMTAMLELPGLKKSDIRIVMNTCPYSGVRQLTISGRSRPSLPQGMYTVQERKFGDFSRTIPLPMNTRAEDVVAIMEDGILILKVPGGKPAPREEPQEVAIH